MRRLVFGRWVSAALLLGLGIVGASASPALSRGRDGPVTAVGPSSQAMVAQRLAALPLSFEPNRGQVNRQVRFLARGSGYTLFLTKREAVLSLRGAGHQQTVLRLQPVGAASHLSIVGQSRLPGAVSYFIGKDSRSWHANLPTYARVLERGVYPGIDLAYYGHGGRLEYDWLLHPGADPSRIALRIDGARHLALTPTGDLTLRTAAGAVIQHHPLAYQQVGHGRHAIPSRYVVDVHGSVLKVN